MSNRKQGTSFERELCERLSDRGFWVHNLAQNSRGQPFDVIAVRNGCAHPIDCKVCSEDIFRLSRIEENQFSAMTLWKDTGNGEGWFALRLNNGAIYMISFSNMEANASLKTVLSEREIRVLGEPLGEWVSKCK